MPDQGRLLHKISRNWLAGKEGRVRLRTLVGLRWVAIAGQLATLFVVAFVFQFPLPLLPCLFVVAASVLVNFFLVRRLQDVQRVSDRGAALQLFYDLLQLTALLFLTGGISNPFSVLLLVPITVSATILSGRATLSLLIAALLLSVFLTFYHFPLPWHSEGFELPSFYLAGVLAAIALTTSFLVLYTYRVSKEARKQADALAATEAILAREHQLVAIGSLAAAAAHELGTPLGTIILTAREIQQEAPPDSQMAEDADLLVREAERCRTILAKLGSGNNLETPFDERPVGAIFREVLKPLEKPEVQVIIDIDEALAKDPAFRLPARPELLYGLGNFMENAISFADKNVLLKANSGTGKNLEICIEDDGSGFDSGLLDQLGEPYISNRTGSGLSAAGGLGLGIFIGKTMLERTGAMVKFSNRQKGGARIKIEWDEKALATLMQAGMRGNLEIS